MWYPRYVSVATKDITTRTLDDDGDCVSLVVILKKVYSTSTVTHVQKVQFLLIFKSFVESHCGSCLLGRTDYHTLLLTPCHSSRVVNPSSPKMTSFSKCSTSSLDMISNRSWVQVSHSLTRHTRRVSHTRLQFSQFLNPHKMGFSH